MKSKKKKRIDEEALSKAVLEETRKFLEENRKTILYRASKKLLEGEGS